ncbi:MAG: PAN domain-containing protein [Pseudomonadota bacterium]
MSQTVEIRHNTKLLEEALHDIALRAALPAREAEATVKERELRASAWRRLATGIAIGLAALGIGVAVWFMKYEHPVPPAPKKAEARIASDTKGPRQKTPLEKSPPKPVIEKPKEEVKLIPPPDPLPDPVPAKPSYDTKDYTIFTLKTLSYDGRSIKIEAGHRFKTEADQAEQNWALAWCYTKIIVDGVQIHIQFAIRKRKSDVPQISHISKNTLRMTRLSSADVLALAAQCPWLDKKVFRVADLKKNTLPTNTEFRLDGNTLYITGEIGPKFFEEVTKYNFKRLIINSKGGRVWPAVKVGRWLRANQISVHATKLCASACVLVLAGGTLRTAADGTLIGVHRMRKVGGKIAATDFEGGQAATVEAAQYLTEMGVAQELWVKMFQTPARTMEYVKHEQLIEWGLLSKPKSILPSPDEKKNSEWNRRNFKGYINFDAQGKDLRTHRGATTRSCRRRCERDSRCEGVVYDRWNRLCILKQDIKTLSLNAKSVFWTRSKRTFKLRKTPPVIWPRSRKAFPDAPYKTEKVSNFDACSRLCLADKRCMAINFRASGNCEMIELGSDYSDHPSTRLGYKVQE